MVYFEEGFLSTGQSWLQVGKYPVSTPQWSWLLQKKISPDHSSRSTAVHLSSKQLKPPNSG